MARSSSFTLLVLLGLSATTLGATPLQVSVVAPDAPSVHSILDAGTPVDFGTSTVGTAVSKAFLVRNAGTETVTLANKIKVPKGFTLMRRFDTNVLAPGRTTTFTLALNSAAAGPLGGPVTVSYQGAQAGKTIFTVAGTAFGPPSVRTVTNGDTAFQTTGQWSAAPRVGGNGQVSVAASGTGSNTATWTFTGLKPGQYQVAVTWTPSHQQASNAGFTVLNGKVPFTAVPVNQKQAPADFQDANVGWKVLGKAYRITSDTLSVQLTDRANGAVAADAVRIARVGFPSRILSPGEPGFSLTGTKSAAIPSQGQGLNVVRLSATAQATWTFTGLVPGQYRISTTWNANPKGATNPAYTILDGSKALTTVQVNQRQTPADLTDAGRAWKDLGRMGSLYYVKNKTLVVTLSTAGVNGPVDLGPIRVERIYNPGGSPPPGGGPDGTTLADAVRFLEQSTWGPNDTEVNNVVSMGITGYLYNQLNATYTGFPVLPFPTDNSDGNVAGTTCDHNVYGTGELYNDCQRNNYQTYPLQRAFYTNGLYGQDQLRQRMAWALHKIWVVSALSYGIPARMSYYLQVLDQSALGNYGDIMWGITLNPAMGDYLNMDNSSKSAPNENYAREILQLFTVGLNQLNPDGTQILDGNGYPIPTYTQDTIVNFAKTFTGWTKAPPLATGNLGITNYRDPMVVRTPITSYHDQTQKTLLDGGQYQIVPAGQDPLTDLDYAMGNIWTHPNLAPFVSKSLIQQLVTSNPTPDYVARVAQVFLDDGTGTQGNLQAVAFAILTDPAARGDYATDPAFGKLREPVQLVLNLLRAFNATSYDATTYSDGYLNPQTANLDQDVLRPTTVFSYFLPGFALPNDASGQGLVGPEFQLFDSVNTFRRINLVNTLFMAGSGQTPNYGIAPTGSGGLTAPYGTRPDLSYLKSFNDQDPNGAPYAMADYVNYLLLHGTMSTGDGVSTFGMYGYLDGQGGGDGLVYAIWKVPQNSNVNQSIKRAQTAVYLVGSSSQYQIQQ